MQDIQNIIISCHIDNVFDKPRATLDNRIMRGACDNLAGILVVSNLLDIPSIRIEFPEGEEDGMQGATRVANLIRENGNNTLVVVVDVTGVTGANINFTIENCKRVVMADVKRVLSASGFDGKYKIVTDGAPSEAYIYGKYLPVIEIDVPCYGEMHSLDAYVKVKDILTTARALRTICTAALNGKIGVL
ncbi:MAG: M28 family peptidase [bacterium]